MNFASGQVDFKFTWPDGQVEILGKRLDKWLRFQRQVVKKYNVRETLVKFTSTLQYLTISLCSL